VPRDDPAGDRRPRTRLYELCKLGLVPAEVLPQTHRHQLFRELKRRGMTVREIAALTMTTDYTVARILEL
jgi:hypothetical protein